VHRLGDLRNCLNQLVTEPSIGSQLFEYRFTGAASWRATTSAT
jgi:2-phospho-L-lactate transferase/gluconeogenesis factor (CofD/UPF0052 family)